MRTEEHPLFRGKTEAASEAVVALYISGINHATSYEGAFDALLRVWEAETQVPRRPAPGGSTLSEARVFRGHDH